MRQSISLRHAVAFGWTTFKQRFGLFAAVLLTMLSSWVLLEVAVIAGQPFGVIWWAGAHLVFFVIFSGMQVGFLYIVLVLYDGGEPRFADLFRHMSWGPQFLAAQVLYLIAVVFGLLLLLIPGLYFGSRFALFGFCFIEHDAGVLSSFQAGAAHSKDVTVSLFGILLSLLLFNLLGALLLGVGLFLTIPVSGLIMAAVYRQLNPQPNVTNLVPLKAIC